MRGYGKQRQPAGMALEIDIRKAYDSVSWSFLQAFMVQLGFPTAFVNWIMMCVTSPWYSLNANGTFFKVQRELGNLLHSHLIFL